MIFSVVFFGNVIAYMGPYKYPVMGLSLVVLILVGICIREKFIIKNDSGERYKTGMNALLVAGSLTGAVGLLSQIIGIWRALSAIIEAADISPEIVFLGIQMSFAAPIYGLSTTVVAAIAWLLIKYIPAKHG
jgi:biopolymer transport protein ExbB/TolQ